MSIKTLITNPIRPDKMTDSDEKKVRQMIADITGQHHAELKGLLNVMSANLVRIEEIGSRTEKHAERTNGRVTKLEEQVSELKNAEITHVLKCPNIKDIKVINEKVVNLEKMEVSRKAVSTFTWKQIGAIGIIAGTVLGILTFILNIIEK
jgi:hypothetical protein